MGKNTELTPRKRRCIEVLHTEGLNNTQVASKLKCSRSAVSRLVKRFDEEGNTDRRARSGRPRISSGREDRILQRICCKNRFMSSRSLAIDWTGSTGVRASSSIVRRRLCNMGLSAKKPLHKPLLTSVMKKKRFNWAKQHQGWTAENWRHVIFSDESKICLNSAKPPVVRRRSGEALSPGCYVQTVKHPVGVMVWGCFSHSGLGRIKFIKGTMNSDGYEEIVRTEVTRSARDMFGDQPWIFQQDLAPCHTSKKMTRVFDELGMEVLPWPGNSPDLNPIENLWHILKKKVNERQPKTERELKEAILRCWNRDISGDITRSLIDSMPTRVSQVLNAKGSITKY